MGCLRKDFDSIIISLGCQVLIVDDHGINLGEKEVGEEFDFSYPFEMEVVGQELNFVIEEDNFYSNNQAFITIIVRAIIAIEEAINQGREEVEEEALKDLFHTQAQNVD